MRVANAYRVYRIISLLEASLIALLVSSVVGPGVALAQTPPWVAQPNGTLDSRFGVGGFASTVAGVQKSAIQSDGKTVVVGIHMVRHNIDGSVDSTFGVQGMVSNVGGRRIVIQRDGKLLILGDPTGSNVLARYNADGSPDSSFGAVGHVPIPFTANDITVGTDGQIIAAGRLWNIRPTPLQSDSDLAVARYNPDGSLDSGFGTGGTVITPIGGSLPPGSNEFANAVRVQADGKIVAAGARTTTYCCPGFGSIFLLVRYHTDGALDSGFGSGGVVYTSFFGHVDEATAMLIQPDGKIISGGRAGSNRSGYGGYLPDFGLTRHLPDGTRDVTFGTDGKVITTLRLNEDLPAQYEWSVLVALSRQIDGKILAAGQTSISAPDAAAVALVQYQPNGALDRKFGKGDVVTIDLPHNSGATDVDVYPDGKVLITAISRAALSRNPASLARYRYDSARGAFGGTPHALPGRIEAEHYDLGGQGVGYFDTTPGNEQGPFVFRTDEVDIKVSTEGGHAVRLAAGEWLAYTAKVPRAGTYSIKARVGSKFAYRMFHIEVNGQNVTGLIGVPQLVGKDAYQTVRVDGIPLPVGQALIRVVMDSSDGFINFQWLSFVEPKVSQ